MGEREFLTLPISPSPDLLLFLAQRRSRTVAIVKVGPVCLGCDVKILE